MKRMIYTAGLGGQRYANVKRLVDERHAIVMDIRFPPDAPLESGASLRAVLGNRYVQNRHWGKRPDRSIPDFDKGAKWLLDVLQWSGVQCVILLCSCRGRTECHRGVLAEMLAEHRIETTELRWDFRRGKGQPVANRRKELAKAGRPKGQPVLFDGRIHEA